MERVPRVAGVRPQPVILVAEDDRDTRELYRACFDTSGYRTSEAGTGSQAIVAAVDIVPDVLLTDYVLPDVDGVTVARRLKADRRTAGIRILMVTGYGSTDVQHAAAAAGIDRVLLKPCLPHIVMREVARALARPVRIGATVSERALDRDASMTRVRAEFGGLPGLALTAEQARLVFDLGRDTAEGILQALVTEGFLSRTPDGSFKRPPIAGPGRHHGSP
jgi:CheY-like chemotaxis protein